MSTILSRPGPGRLCLYGEPHWTGCIAKAENVYDEITSPILSPTFSTASPTLLTT